MSALTQPIYNTIKKNLCSILDVVSAAEVTAGNPGFTTERDRYRNWDVTETLKARVNILLASLAPESGGSQRYTKYRATFNVDMYVLGGSTTEEVEDSITTLTPANIEAADRLDLLISQVQFGLTQLAAHDFGLPAGTIERATKGINLTISNQGDDRSVGVFAPARWSIDVMIPYYASDNGSTANLTNLNITLNRAIEDMALQYTYSHT
jgi:hypothetical protein